MPPSRGTLILGRTLPSQVELGGPSPPKSYANTFVASTIRSRSQRWAGA